MKKNILIILLILVVIGQSFWIFANKKSNNPRISEKSDLVSVDKESNNTKINNQEEKPQNPNNHPIDKALDKCMEDKYNTNDMNECVYQAMDSWFVEIGKYLDLFKDNLNDSDYQSVLSAQENWKKYQESEFEAIGAIFDKKQGSMYRNIEVGDKNELVKQRALELKNLYELLVDEF